MVFAARLFLLVVSLIAPMLCSAGTAQAQIVAIGASNVAGRGVSSSDAWPAQLQGMLAAKGRNVQVTNAGISGDTNAGMLARLDSAVPRGPDRAARSLRRRLECEAVGPRQPEHGTGGDRSAASRPGYQNYSDVVECRLASISAAGRHSFHGRGTPASRNQNASLGDGRRALIPRSRPQHVLMHLAAVEMEERHGCVVLQRAGGEPAVEFGEHVLGHGMCIRQRL